MCQIRKTKIEVRANIGAHADARQVARLVVDSWGNETTDMANSNGEAEINSINVELAKFGIQTKMSLADSVCKTRCKCVISDFKKYSNNNLITLLIMNIRTEFAIHME